MRKVPNPPVFAIGLTGGISSGKSVAGEYLRRYFKVMDADALVHDLYQSDSSLIADIAHEFGENCVRNGRVDRKTLGNLVFKNPRSLDRLNSIVHPIVGKRLTDEIERARSEKEITVFLIPLLFEHHWQEKLDSVVLVGCSPATQLARILSRDQRSEEEARAIVASQMPLVEKQALCDISIINDSDLESFYQKLEHWAQGILR